MTAMPAAVYGLTNKGLVREGFDADLCIFDPETIQDHATFTDPTQRCTGLSHVIVGGKLAAVDAVSTGELGGTMLYRDL
jgi:N-acyl-D-amino-acid deacylase